MDYGDWSNPLVMDSEMSVEDAFEAFVNHPEESVEQSSFFADSFASPLPATPGDVKPHIIHNGSSSIAHQNSALQPGSIASSTSPDSSSQDSSSDSSRRRKRDTTFSTSPGRPLDDVDIKDDRWHKPSPADSLIPGSLSPYHIEGESEIIGGLSSVNSPDMLLTDAHDQTITPSRIDRRVESQTMNSSSFLGKSGFVLGGSRDSSPTEGFSLASQQGSPMIFEKPAGVFTALDGLPTTPGWSPAHFKNMGVPSTPPQMQTISARGVPLATGPTKLVITETSTKSRVETQINVAFTLHSPPEGVRRLHLPTHTISKVKLLAKSVEKRPDTLELHSMLVCASAMQKPTLREQALRRAAGLEPMPDRKRSTSSELPDCDDENDPTKPLNGGEVKICANCINRERKRSTRKKAKKQEDEETWNEHGEERVILFNEKEYQEWRAVDQSEDSGFPLKNALRIDVPMRITCYCRHHNEKIGFQAIFTIKDHEGRLVAQEMTRPILITDDHKTQPPPNTLVDAPTNDWLQQQLKTDQMNDQQMFGHRPVYSYSTNDLSSLSNNNNGHLNSRNSAEAQIPPRPKGTNPLIAHTNNQRNLSRQASPSVHVGPNKKRKSSSSHQRIPSGLTMTRVDTGIPSTGPMSGSSSVPVSPFAADPTSLGPHNVGLFGNHMEQPQQHSGFGQSSPNMFSPGRRDMNIDNMNYYSVPNSVPNSAHASRAGSPVSTSRQVMNQYQQQHQAGFSNSIPTMQSLQATQNIPSQTIPMPTIHKLTPVEGPLTGGIEVACFGVGFDRNTEVLFGDRLATTTTYWGPNTLTCLLPPSPVAGNVAVTVRSPGTRGFPSLPISNPSTTFRYYDDTVNKLVVMALRTIADKKTGNENNAVGFLLKIAESKEAWEGFGAADSGTVFQSLQTLGLDNTPANLAALEGNLLKLLDAIDLDDSPHPPHFDLQQENGSTMLSLACSLGLTRFVAALLARGSDPDIRDGGGFTPLMFASLHGHAAIVRKLVSKGADPTIRSLQGYRALDLASSDQVREALQETKYRLRSRSTGTLSYRSRASSIASLSAWESTTQSRSGSVFSEDDVSVNGEDVDGISGNLNKPLQTASWIQSRRGSFAAMNEKRHNLAPADAPHPAGLLAPAAAMNAWRNQLVAQIYQFQQSVNSWNFPQFQIPALPPMPQLESYQDHPMVRKISSLVPQRAPAESSSCSSSDGTVTADNSKWDYSSWFSSLSPSPPPYEEVYPDKVDRDVQSKAGLYQAAADHIADQKCSKLFDSQETKGSSTAVDTTTVADVKVRVWSKSLSTETQEQLRAAHAQSSKRISSDRRLFFCWIPLMIIIAIAMFTDWFQDLFTAVSVSFRARTDQRIIVEV